jgi:hypothetical protein
MNNKTKNEILITPYVFYFIYAITGIIILLIFKNNYKEFGITYTVILINTIYILSYTFWIYLAYSLGHHIFAWLITIFPVFTLILTLCIVKFNIKNDKETVVLKGPEIIVDKNNYISVALNTYLHRKTAFDAWIIIIDHFFTQ